MRQSPRTVASDPEMADDVQQALTKALATGTPARVFRRGVASAAACEAAAKAVERATGTPCKVKIEHCFNITSTALGDEAGGGMRHEAASAIAQQAGGCFVIKVSEDACGCADKPIPDAMMDIFDGCKIAKQMLIRA